MTTAKGAIHVAKKDYILVVWEYDAVPDAESLYWAKVWLNYRDKDDAVQKARNYVEHKDYVGAAVYQDGKEVAGFGLVLDYEPK